MAIPQLKLSDGHSIPQVGLGTWRIKEPDEFQTAFNAAVKAGYRHFDTAQAYRNEDLLGAAWRGSGLKREDLFITTKIAVEHFGYGRTKKSFAESLKRLQTDYVDLILLHFPVPILRNKSWQALEEIRAAGGAKSIGVSNYTIRHLEEMSSYAKTAPAVNQVELHVFLQQPELVKHCQKQGIAIEAYSPLAHARDMDNPAIAKIAVKHGKTYAQIMLRWCLQQKTVVLPKSVTPRRIKENIDIFDFELDDRDMKDIAGQDQGLHTAWSPVHVP